MPRLLGRSCGREACSIEQALGLGTLRRLGGQRALLLLGVLVILADQILIGLSPQLAEGLGQMQPADAPRCLVPSYLRPAGRPRRKGAASEVSAP